MGHLINGEPFAIGQLHAVRQVCCDCALVHLYVLELTEDGEVVLTPYRDDFETERERKKRGIAGIRHRKKPAHQRSQGKPGKD